MTKDVQLFRNTANIAGTTELVIENAYTYLNSESINKLHGKYFRAIPFNMVGVTANKLGLKGEVLQ